MNKIYFLSIVGENYFPNKEHDVRQTIQQVEATSWLLREYIRVRELAETHRLGRMRRLHRLEEKKAWKREAGFDKVETTTEMDAKRLRAGFDSEPLKTKLYNPR